MAPKRTTRSKKALAASPKRVLSPRKRKTPISTVVSEDQDETADQTPQPTSMSTPSASCTAIAPPVHKRHTVVVMADIHVAPAVRAPDKIQPVELSAPESSDTEETTIIPEVSITPPPKVVKKQNLQDLTPSTKRLRLEQSSEGTEWDEEEENELIEMWKTHDFLYVPEKQQMNSRVNRKFTIQHFARQLKRTGENKFLIENSNYNHYSIC